jgi:hypothetical protein
MSSPFVKTPFSSAVVTVVIPAYNHARYIVEALDSVRSQTKDLTATAVGTDISTKVYAGSLDIKVASVSGVIKANADSVALTVDASKVNAMCNFPKAKVAW